MPRTTGGPTRAESSSPSSTPEPVYALFGRKGLGVAGWPAVNQPVLGDALAYHYRTGPHAITPYDWAQYLDFADRMIK